MEFLLAYSWPVPGKIHDKHTASQGFFTFAFFIFSFLFGETKTATTFLSPIFLKFR